MSVDERAQDTTMRSGVPPIAIRPLAIGLAVMAAVLVAASTGYGYHRDELYFLACGRHLAWGYPDQPPLTPVLAHLTELVAPHSTVALRLPAVGITVWATLASALIARELGGARAAQVLTALAVGTGTFVLVSGRLLATSTADFGVWVTLTWLVVRMLRTGRPQLWVAVGAVMGVGLLNKQLPLFLAFALGVGILLTRQARPLLRSRWLAVGVVIASVAWAPALGWQAAHGWPQLTLAGQIHAEYGQVGNRIGAAALQVVMFSLGATVLWVVGLVRLFRDPAWRTFRPIAWAWPVLMMVFGVTAGQGYYPSGLYPALIAAGAVVIERRRRRGRVLITAGVAVSAAMLAPAALPVLPPGALDRSVWAGVGEQQREMVGWPQLADKVADAYRTLPPSARATAVIMTSNYGEAGALQEYGPARGLPAVHSGHNGFGLWGQPPDDAVPILLVWEDDPATDFTACRSRGRVRTGVSNEESRYASVYVCDAPIGGWAARWPRLVHLSS
jgi:hypothetical protein